MGVAFLRDRQKLQLIQSDSFAGRYTIIHAIGFCPCEGTEGSVSRPDDYLGLSSNFPKMILSAENKIGPHRAVDR